jgi:LPS sulfotransferase NodH
VVGLIGWKRDGKSFFCKLPHAPGMLGECRHSIQRVNISREWMAKWLVSGVPISRAAPKEERALLGVQHRQGWARPVA